MALRAQLRTSCINCRRQCVAVPMQPHHGLSMPLGKSRVAPSFAAPTTECKRPSKASGQAMQAAKQSTTLVQAVVQKEAGLMQASSWEIPTKMKVLIASCLAFTVSNMVCRHKCVCESDHVCLSCLHGVPHGMCMQARQACNCAHGPCAAFFHLLLRTR